MKKFNFQNSFIYNNFIKTVGVGCFIIFTFSSLPTTVNFVTKFFKYNNTTFSKGGVNFDIVALESSLKKFRKIEKIVEDNSQRYADITVVIILKIENAPRFNVVQLPMYLNGQNIADQVRKTKLVIWKFYL